MLRIVDWRGAPVHGAGVLLLKRTPTGGLVVFRDVTDVHGLVLVPTPQGSGPHDISITPPVGRDDLGSIVVAPWLGESETLAMERAFVLHGAFRPRRGGRIPDQVSLLGAGGFIDIIETDAAGVFRRQEVPWGPVDLEFAVLQADGSTSLRQVRIMPEEVPLQIEVD